MTRKEPLDPEGRARERECVCVCVPATAHKGASSSGHGDECEQSKSAGDHDLQCQTKTASGLASLFAFAVVELRLVTCCELLHSAPLLLFDLALSVATTSFLWCRQCRSARSQRQAGTALPSQTRPTPSTSSLNTLLRQHHTRLQFTPTNLAKEKRTEPIDGSRRRERERERHLTSVFRRRDVKDDRQTWHRLPSCLKITQQPSCIPIRHSGT